MTGPTKGPLDLPVVHRDKLKLVAKYHRKAQNVMKISISQPVHPETSINKGG